MDPATSELERIVRQATEKLADAIKIGGSGAVAQALNRLGNDIASSHVDPIEDASGTMVDSLTDAVTGVTAGLMAIAKSIDGLAAAVRERGST